MGLIANLKWNYISSISKIDKTHKNITGVYIWVLEGGSKKRIIYVGTAFGKRGLYERTKTHLNHFRLGKYTVFKFELGEDPYDLLIANSLTMRNYINNNILFYPDGQNKEPDWIKKYLPTFFERVRVWICPIGTSKDDCEFLESQIQIVLRSIYNIGYSSNQSNFTWLGKIPKSGKPELLSYNFKFNNFPEVTEVERILNNLQENVRFALYKKI